MKTARDLNRGKKGRVWKIRQGEYNQRLISLGVLPNTEIELVRSTMMGSALYIKLDNQILALRKQEAESILLKSND